MKFKWREEQKHIVENKINNNEITFFKIGIINAIQSGNIKKAAENFKFMLYRIFSCLQIKERRAHQTKNTSWFDQECRTAKKEVRHNLRIFGIKAGETEKIKYIDSKKRYKFICKQKKKKNGAKIG